MHNISKHIIYLKESSNAAVLTATRVYEHHQELTKRCQSEDNSQMMQAVHGLLLHKRTLLEDCTLRVNSMENRIQNLTNLARALILHCVFSTPSV